MLNNKGLRCLPRAEINNSLTGEVGKQAVRDWGSVQWRREPGGGRRAELLESALGTGRAVGMGAAQGTVGPGEGLRGRARATESSRKRMGFVARWMWALIMFCHFSAE